MESATQKKSSRVDSVQSFDTKPLAAGGEVRSQIERYLRAWGYPRTRTTEEWAVAIVTNIERRMAIDPRLDPMDAAIEETDSFLKAKLREQFRESEETPTPTLSLEQRVILAIADFPEHCLNPVESAARIKEATLRLNASQIVHRDLESVPTRMRTTLTRLPTFRLVGGWCLFITLLVLAFIFTH